jgi:hypothetical protein
MSPVHPDIQRKPNVTLQLLQYRSRYFELRFYIHALKWLITNDVPKDVSPHDVYRLFYLGFLNMDERYIDIVEITDDRLVTRSTNPCPILKIAEEIGVSTNEICLKTSERGCKFFLRGISKDIEFIRDYKRIRPHVQYCEETILVHRR